MAKSSSAIGPQLSVDNAVTQDLPASFHFGTHLHRTVELLICQSGTIVITIQGVPQEVCMGEYLVVFPNVLHSADVPLGAPCRILQTHFHSREYSDLASDRLPAGDQTLSFELTLNKRKFLKGTALPQLEACLAGLRTELSLQQENREKMVTSYLSQLNILVSRDLDVHAGGKGLYGNRYLVNATLFVNERYMDKLTVSELAQAVGVSARYLTRLFQEELHLGVSTYITYVRISKSIDFMYAHPNYPLTSLALDMGFSSQQHFSKVFKEKMGISPKKYFSIRPISAC
ncbi:MAG: AraC family transcriptional regulator [Oscillospiraceae bacterium]